MKHSYVIDCDCVRCARERIRRNAQSTANPQLGWQTVTRKARIRKANSRRPIVGSQEWAETRGDDLGDSGDR